MYYINYKNIDFSKMSKLDDISSTNDIYLYKDKIIKIFKKYSKEQLKELEFKIELFDEKTNFEFLSVPNYIIKKDGIITGTISPFIENSFTLNELLHRKSILEELNVIRDISIKLSKLHNSKSKIVVGDMHFDNVIIDNKNNSYFIDVESYGIDTYKPSDIPSITYNYYTWMNYYLQHSDNMDRISFFLALFSTIFDKNIISVSENEYELKMQDITVLSKLKEVFLDLKYSYAEEPDIPYLYEVITNDDMRYNYAKN